MTYLLVIGTFISCAVSCDGKAATIPIIPWWWDNNTKPQSVGTMNSVTIHPTLPELITTPEHITAIRSTIVDAPTTEMITTKSISAKPSTTLPTIIKTTKQQTTLVLTTKTTGLDEPITESKTTKPREKDDIKLTSTLSTKTTPLTTTNSVPEWEITPHENTCTDLSGHTFRVVPGTGCLSFLVGDSLNYLRCPIGLLFDIQTCKCDWEDEAICYDLYDSIGKIEFG